MEKILIPVDFSDCSFNAAVYALHLAKRWEVEIHLLHVIQVPLLPNTPYTVSLNLADNIAAGRYNHLGEFWGQVLRASHTGPAEVSVHLRVKKEYHLDAIIETAVETAANLIIMGTKGASGTKKLFGSNAAYILQHAAVPVLLVPKGYEFKGLNRILIVGNSQPGKDANPLLRQLVTLFQSKTEALQVTNAPDHQAILEQLNDRFVSNNTLVYADKGRAAKALREYSREHADLVVIDMEEYDLSGMAKRVGRELAFTSRVPVMANR